MSYRFFEGLPKWCFKKRGDSDVGDTHIVEYQHHCHQNKSCINGNLEANESAYGRYMMLVTALSWWNYDVDSFELLVTEFDVSHALIVSNIDVAATYDVRERFLLWKQSDIFCEVVSFNSILVDKDPQNFHWIIKRHKICDKNEWHQIRGF